MISLDTGIVEIFLNRNTDWCSTAPYAYDVIGSETALQNSQSKKEGVPEKFLGLDEYLVIDHGQKIFQV